MKTTITNILTRRVTRLMTMAVLLTAIVSGCANDDSLSPLPEEEQQMTLQFTITAQRLYDRSRTLLLPSGTEQIGSPAENIIDTEHITFLLFDGSKRLITLFYPTVAPENSDEGKNSDSETPFKHIRLRHRRQCGFLYNGSRQSPRQFSVKVQLPDGSRRGYIADVRHKIGHHIRSTVARTYPYVRAAAVHS